MRHQRIRQPKAHISVDVLKSDYEKLWELARQSGEDNLSIQIRRALRLYLSKEYPQGQEEGRAQAA